MPSLVICAKLYMYTGFSLLEGMGESPHQPKFLRSEKFLCSFLRFLPTKYLFPPHQKSIQPNKKIKTSFSVVVTAPVPFLF